MSPGSPERDYSHRDVVDKLGIKPGQAVAFHGASGPVDAALRDRVLVRAGREPADPAEAVDVLLITADAESDTTALLERWKRRLQPAGGIWVLTPKRGQPGYVDQRLIIEAGLASGLVDNKSCSVSDTTSGLRFVFRKQDRPSSR